MADALNRAASDKTRYSKGTMDITTVQIKKPDDANIILGHAHFIKTVEDIYEAMVNSVSGIRFGIAFCEASGPCLVRSEGNDKELEKIAVENAMDLSVGHSFIIVMQDAFPVNVLDALKGVPEVCTVYCATANPLEIIVVQTKQGRGIIGVVDGFSPKGKESTKNRLDRKRFLRDIGYKL
jgi:uncharacterized protein